MRLLKLLLILFAFAAGPAVAGPFEDGEAAFSKGDYATALRLWQPLAQQGDARAQNGLGALYQRGLGVPQDLAEAMRWFQKSAAPRTSTKVQEVARETALPQYGTEEYHRWLVSILTTVDTPAKKDSERFLSELAMKRLTETARFQGYSAYKDGDLWILDTRTGRVQLCSMMYGCRLMEQK